jgi:hypothetical protein
MPDYADWYVKLLATADHPNTSPEEASACRAKAAELEARHGPFGAPRVFSYPWFELDLDEYMERAFDTVVTWTAPRPENEDEDYGYDPWQRGQYYDY